MRILVATSNAGKAREFREMLGADRFEWSDLASQLIEPVEETGLTFRANACLKGSHYASHAKLWTLADDSGLAVDALGGKPGVHSARWAQMHNAGQGDQANNALLLKHLEQIPAERRTAKFVCVLALSDPQGRIVLTTQDHVEGVIINDARGGNGFGYDPLFFIPSLGKTTAQLSPEDKHAISHRGKALRRMRELMGLISLSPYTGRG